MTRFYARLVVALLAVNAIAQLAMATDLPPAAHTVEHVRTRIGPRSTRGPGTSHSVALMRVWVSESGWGSVADQRGIYQVLATRAKSTHPNRIIAMAKRYSGCTFPPHENPNRGKCSERSQWVSEITATCAKPMSAPVSEALWRQFYRPKCLEMLRRAKLMLAGQLDDGCVVSATVHHWGGPMDDHRAKRAGWVRVRITCGLDEPLNHFWNNPRRGGNASA